MDSDYSGPLGGQESLNQFEALNEERDVRVPDSEMLHLLEMAYFAVNQSKKAALDSGERGKMIEMERESLDMILGRVRYNDWMNSAAVYESGIQRYGGSVELYEEKFGKDGFVPVSDKGRIRGSLLGTLKAKVKSLSLSTGSEPIARFGVVKEAWKVSRNRNEVERAYNKVIGNMGEYNTEYWRSVIRIWSQHLTSLSLS